MLQKMSTREIEEEEETISSETFYSFFEENLHLLRALTRQKLFAGTISIGGGSCQVTQRSQYGLQHCQVFSIPFGNKWPMRDVARSPMQNLEARTGRRYPRTKKAVQVLQEL